ncbi:MAG: endonuclease/exonuclease/phosphatase family protein [Planctomycetes bacterium]|nr:endonuclease/exonuclease/phosphatase family protein [Planctomycetota bacterium]
MMIYSARILLACVALAAIGRGDLPQAAEPGAPPPAAPPRVFTVATYNINWGDIDPRHAVAVIRAAGADLVVLQETTARSEAHIRRHLAREFPWMRFQGHQGQYAAERFGILSTVEVKGLRFLPPRHGLFGIWIGQVELGGRRLQVVNVHLQPALLSEKMNILQAMKALGDMESVHQKEIAAIHASLDPEGPALVAGDFNSTADLAAGKFLAGKGFVDSFASVTEQPEKHPTWRWPTRHLALTARIDHIFHTRQIETIASRVIAKGASDHYLLVSRLQWSAPD